MRKELTAEAKRVTKIEGLAAERDGLSMRVRVQQVDARFDAKNAAGCTKENGEKRVVLKHNVYRSEQEVSGVLVRGVC